MLADGPMIDTHRVVLAAPDDFDGWRDVARDLAEAGVYASAVVWQVDGADRDLFGSGPSPAASAAGFPVPRAFIQIAQDAICHSDPERFALLYTLLLRIRANRHAIEDQANPLVRRLHGLAKEVRRDVHKMHAFVRFRELPSDTGTERFVAFFEPDHYIVRRTAGFFVNRFANMIWSILTPELSIHWDLNTLTEGPGAIRADAPDGDPLEETWRTYYSSIFNPARLKVGAMLKEMPKKYWRNMPETALIGPLIATARNRELEMIERSAAANIGIVPGPHIEPGGNIQASWDMLRQDAARCTRCDLYEHATQTVFGEGPIDAAIMFVGEQPGDQEDLAGRPFVGPAGQIFNASLEKAGIDRATVYVTNAVKHFKFVDRGKKRIHSKPGTGEIEACRWWIDRERELLRPPLTVALGATAAHSLFGKTMAIGRNRGAALNLADGSECWITVHPSFLLRIPEEDRRREERALFVRDLERVKARAAELAR